MSETTGTKRGPYARSLARRAKIAKVVLDIIDEQGLEAVTTALVAKRARMPEPSVLYHFPTKDHLLVAAQRRSDDETAVEAGADQQDVELDIETIRVAGVLPREAHPHRARLDALVRTLAMNPDHPAAGYIEERNLRAVKIWSSMIARRQRAGLADPTLDPDAVAWQAIGLLDGLTVISMANKDLPVGDLLADGLLRLTGGNPQG